MNDYSQPHAGKISVHGKRAGAPSPERVERRAREIAMIDERNPDEFTEADWRQARHELMGTKITRRGETPDNADLTLTEEWSVSPAPRAPHAAPGYRGRGNGWRALRDRRSRGSAHDQMLEARREELEQEGEIL